MSDSSLCVFMSKTWSDLSAVLRSIHLADEKCPEEATLLVHVHSGGVGHSHEEAVAAPKREQPPLVGGVQGELGSPGPAGGLACLHQQDWNLVGVHLVADRQVSLDVFLYKVYK